MGDSISIEIINHSTGEAIMPSARYKTFNKVGAAAQYYIKKFLKEGSWNNSDLGSVEYFNNGKSLSWYQDSPKMMMIELASF